MVSQFDSPPTERLGPVFPLLPSSSNVRSSALLALSCATCCALPACETGYAHETPLVAPVPLFDIGYASVPTDWLRVPEVCLIGDAPAGAAERVAERARRIGLRVASDVCAWQIEFVSSPPALEADAQAAWDGANRDEAHAIVTTLEDGVLLHDLRAAGCALRHRQSVRELRGEREEAG